MKMSLVAFVVLCLSCVTLFAQGKIDLQLSDSIHDIRDRNVGQMVEFPSRSGEKIGGKVERLGDKLVFISHISGAEFYDATVQLLKSRRLLFEQGISSPSLEDAAP